MKRLFQLLAVASFGLALGSCDKSEPTHNGREGGSLSDPQRFELSSSLGSVGIEPLSSNTDTADDELRATLHFKGKDNVAKTTLKAENFGKDGNLKAYWGVIYGTNQNAVEVCTDAVTTEPDNPNALTESTVYFQGTESSTIQSKRIKMYAIDNTNLPNITKGIMLLDGKAEGSMVHFTKAKGCDPNDRIEGVAKNGFQEGRHIPIMTELKPIEDMKPSSSKNGEVKFTPRGSLIGLCLKNKIGEDMIVTGIVVPKSGALDFAGSFDWSQDGKPSFTKDYGTDTEPALVFPVYENSTATDKGYTIANNNAEAPCFFVWGFQDEAKKGQPFQVQIRYKTASNSTEETTRTFTVYAPTSKVVTTEKKFDDGYAYNVVLTINKANSKGGSTGTDWGNGGTALPNDSESAYYPFSISQKNTPLDFVAEAPAINKVGTGFVLNHNVPATNVIADMSSNEVGYYNYEQLEALSTSNKPFLANYVIPTAEQALSIMPYWAKDVDNNDESIDINAVVRFDKISSLQELTERAQVGSEPAEDYRGSYITLLEDGVFITYALRFKGTKWQSAWRYSMEGADNDKKMVIKCISLKGKDESSLDFVNEIAKAEFFANNPATVRTFPCYGFFKSWRNDPVYRLGISCFVSTLIKGNYTPSGVEIESYYRGAAWYDGFASVSLATSLDYAYSVRPFYKQLP